jgi:hypothetical protein
MKGTWERGAYYSKFAGRNLFVVMKENGKKFAILLLAKEKRRKRRKKIN